MFGAKRVVPEAELGRNLLMYNRQYFCVHNFGRTVQCTRTNDSRPYAHVLCAVSRKNFFVE